MQPEQVDERDGGAGEGGRGVGGGLHGFGGGLHGFGPLAVEEVAPGAQAR